MERRSVPSCRCSRPGPGRTFPPPAAPPPVKRPRSISPDELTPKARRGALSVEGFRRARIQSEAICLGRWLTCGAQERLQSSPRRAEPVGYGLSALPRKPLRQVLADLQRRKMRRRTIRTLNGVTCRTQTRSGLWATVCSSLRLVVCSASRFPQFGFRRRRPQNDGGKDGQEIQSRTRLVAVSIPADCARQGDRFRLDITCPQMQTPRLKSESAHFLRLRARFTFLDGSPQCFIWNDPLWPFST